MKPLGAESVGPRSPMVQAPRGRTDIELMRIIASLAVVTIHVAGGALDSAYVAEGSTSHATSLLLDSASRFSVPVFFAISGWTFLVASPVPSVGALGTRILRVLVPLLSWTVIYGVFANREHLGLSALANVAWMFVTGLSFYHFWFLYAYVPLFLAMGLLTFVLRGERSGRDITVTLGALLLLASSGSIFKLVASLRGAAAPTPSGWYAPPYAIAYALLGAVILSEARSGPGVRWAGAAIYVIAVFATVLWGARFGHVDPGDYGSIVTIASALGVLLFLRGASFGPKVTRVIATVGRASFGLYLIHLLVLNAVMRVLVHVPGLASDEGWRGVVRVPAHVVATFALSLAASLLWGRSARLRKLLG